jgi:hypothetical protein
MAEAEVPEDGGSDGEVPEDRGSDGGVRAG